MKLYYNITKYIRHEKNIPEHFQLYDNFKNYVMHYYVNESLIEERIIFQLWKTKDTCIFLPKIEEDKNGVYYYNKTEIIKLNELLCANMSIDDMYKQISILQDYNDVYIYSNKY